MNKIKETGWEKRMLRMYKDNIVGYLRNKTHFKRSDTIEILFTLEHGRVWAVISNGSMEKRVKAVELIGWEREAAIFFLTVITKHYSAIERRSLKLH